MRLKYLEVYGFKSFADRTRLVFDQPVVGIVGPNGSGKSNTADAIRWALGEQSAKSLRGESMEDVIFAGTSKRKPMNMAEVILCFDNSDGSLDLPYEEVTVSRKVYRSGESLYLLNNNPVRRKDIRQLFFDTGVGTDGYSIIGQGRVADILSSDKEDRRDVFDEAAGITKYKNKKEESLRRLERTMEELEGLGHELQVKEKEAVLLSKQAEAARRGYQLTRRLEEESLSLLKRQLDLNQEKIGQGQAELDRIQAYLKEDRAELEKLGRSLAPSQEQLASFEKEEGESREQIRLLEEKMNRLDKARAVKEEEVRFLKEDGERMEREAEERKERLQGLQLSLKEAEGNLARLKREKEEIQLALSQLSQQGGGEEAALRRAVGQVQERAEALAEDLHFLEFDKESKNKQDHQLLEEKKKREEERKDLAGRQEELLEKQALLHREEQDLLSSLQNRKKEEGELEKEEKEGGRLLSQKMADHSQLDRQLSALSSRLEVYQSLVENYEGYSYAVRSLMTYASSHPEVKKHIIGTLADLIEVRSPYEEAVDVCLAGSLQNIVVESQADASYLIQLIKQKKMGRITFLPLDSIQGRQPVRTGAPEEIINAVDAVQADPSLMPVIEHFLGTTSIVEDLDSAIALSHRHFRNRIVSLDGEIINNWGSMVGGKNRRKDQASLLNRKNEVEDLREEISRHRVSLRAVEDEILAINKRLSGAASKKKELALAMEKDREELEKKRTALDQSAFALEKIQSEIGRVESFLGQELSFSEEEYRRRKEELLANQEAVNQEREERQAALDAYLQKARQAEKEGSLLQNRAEYTDRELSIAENAYHDLKDRLENQETTQRNQEEELKELRKKQEDYADFLGKTAGQLEAWKGEREALVQLKQQREEKYQDLQLKVKEVRQKKEERAARIQSEEKEEYQRQVDLSQYQERKKNLLNDYMETADLSLEELEEKLDGLEPVKTSRAQISQLKQELSQIGYFNYDSIQQYQELKEELDFLHGQLSDLQASKEDIEQLVEDLDKTMKAMFKDSFKKINRAYNETFLTLFGGGKAELSLDSQDVLTADIEIKAQPPGKKWQTLALLSGGERSMTAMALLFAIFSIHPTPFCILDEIDASLDEANIGRYLKYLRKLTDQTQFIVITHRKASMEMADMLYGVTMEEGVSKVLSLRFEDYEEKEETTV